MNQYYKKYAYQKAVFAELERHLVDMFVRSPSGEVKAQLICEDVQYANRIVPDDAIIDVITLMQEQQENCARAMRVDWRDDYDFRDRAERSGDGQKRPVDDSKRVDSDSRKSKATAKANGAKAGVAKDSGKQKRDAVPAVRGNSREDKQTRRISPK